MQQIVSDRRLLRFIAGGAAGLVALAIVVSGLARSTDVGAQRLAPLAAVESRDLRFEDRGDGAVLVHEVARPERVHVVEPGKDGFVRIAVRALARERELVGLDGVAPMRLIRAVDGQLWLEDPSNGGRRISLDAFGWGNAVAFDRFLKEGSTP